jgi:hypothetical protein
MIAKLGSTAVLILLAAASANGAARESLLEVLAEYDCQDISDDTRVLRFGDQWWVSLEPFTGRESDFALYCQDNGEEVVARLILVI